MNASQLVSTSLMVAQVILAMALFERGMPRRKSPWPGVVACAIIAAGALAFAMAHQSAIATSVFAGARCQLAGFAILPIAMTLASVALLRVSIWEALFCCTSAYTMQNLASGAAGLAGLTLSECGQDAGSTAVASACTAVATAIVYGCCYALLIRRIGAGRLAGVRDRGMLLVMLLVILVTVVFDMINKTLPIIGVPFPYVAALRLVHGAVCAFILFAEYEMIYNKRLLADAQALERLVAQGKRQYEASRENIEAINIKCHDLKHQIGTLRRASGHVDDAALDEMERAVQIYDASVHTGSEALDTILTEKGLVCESEKIALSCMADGEALSFMAPSDLYSLFGNMLDNAIEATRAIPEQDRRAISLIVRRRAGSIIIHEENWSPGELDFRDGMPLTSKLRADGERDELNHGFGVRSMELVAERYAGTLSTRLEDGVFKLDVPIPLGERGRSTSSSPRELGG